MYVPPQTHFAICQSADICTTALSTSPRESVSCIGGDKQAELGCWEKGTSVDSPKVVLINGRSSGSGLSILRSSSTQKMINDRLCHLTSPL